jgi:adenylate kinase
MGPPGAGKGTQAELIAKRFGVPAISTGDIFRSNVSEGTALGLKAKTYLDAGEYVPDSLTNDMVRDRLAHADAVNGFVLDGYPRTLTQVKFLDDALADAGTELDHVIVLSVDIDEVVKRLHKRALEEGRSDDSQEVIRRRQEVYLDHTEPLIADYDKRGIVFHVDGMGSVDDVAARVADAISQPPHPA